MEISFVCLLSFFSLISFVCLIFFFPYFYVFLSGAGLSLFLPANGVEQVYHEFFSLGQGCSAGSFLIFFSLFSLFINLSYFRFAVDKKLPGTCLLALRSFCAMLEVPRVALQDAKQTLIGVYAGRGR